ncbi:class I SAM-dependent methyltransferase [Amycolatopsis sp. NPDC003865]
MPQEKVNLRGARETLLATLYARALDARAPDPILGDRVAAEVVDRIDYDWARTGVKATSAAGVGVRATFLDGWTAEFLAAHPDATVLHLGCGLDTRVHRLAPPPSVRWCDIDYADVIELRARLLPQPAADYHMIGSSVTDEGWLSRVPADRPTVAVFEGLTMYLHKKDGKQLIQRIVEHFPSGQLLFDSWGTLAIRVQKLVPAIRTTGAHLHWGIDDPAEIEGWHDRLECLDALRVPQLMGINRLPTSARIGMRVMAHLPGLRDFARMLRYRF